MGVPFIFPEPMGLHLKEYTLREVSALLRDAGFGKITMPLVRTRRFVVLAGGGLYRLKRRLEPMLEWIPAWLARYPCQALAFSCTIAEKSDGV